MRFFLVLECVFVCLCVVAQAGDILEFPAFVGSNSSSRTSTTAIKAPYQNPYRSAPLGYKLVKPAPQQAPKVQGSQESPSDLQVATQQVLIMKRYRDFLRQGVPEPALKRLFEFYFIAFGKNLMLKGATQYATVPFVNDRYAGIADFSKPSNVKRFYLLDLQQGTLERYYVSHGQKSGGKWAGVFSNTPNSRMSSLGLYLTAYTYHSPSFGGTALKIFGIDPTNDNAFARSIVVHQASYVTPEFMAERKKDPRDSERMGRSFGCFAFDPAFAQDIIQKLKGGSLIYAYTTGAEKLILQSPDYQEVRIVAPEKDQVVDTEIENQQKENFRKD